jgi:hypothetical protein
MSTGTAVLPGSIPTNFSLPPGEPEAESLDWLLVVLHDTISEVQASDALPLQRASAIARLGNLYLKARRTAGLERALKELTQRVAELEECLASAEARAVEAEERGAAALPGRGSPQESMKSTDAARPADAAGLPPRSAPEPHRDAALRFRLTAAADSSREKRGPCARGHP